jgi:hypothetical protein
VTPERNARPASTRRIGFLATLASLRRGQGSRMPIALCALCVLLALALATTPALAERSKLSAITKANGSPFGGLSAEGVVDGITVDSSGNLWVGDPGGQVVDKFSPSGVFLTQSSGLWSGRYPATVAFSNASNHLYLTDLFSADESSSDVWGLEPSGAYAGIDLTGPWSTGYIRMAIAADNSSEPTGTGGDLYLTGAAASVYRIDGAGAEQAFSAKSEPYVTANKLTGFAAGESFSHPVGVAVDGAGNVYVADAGRNAVYEFEPSGKFLRSFTGANGSLFGSVSAVAVDPSNGHVLIADQTNSLIDEFASTGAYLDNVVEVGEEVGGPFGLAVDSTGKLYVTEGNQVGVYGTYGPHVPRLPKIINGAASGIGLTSATVNATVKPNGEEVSECRFEYGTSEAFGQSAPCTPATFSSTTAVSGQLSGLNPDSAYLYRLHVVNPGTGPAGVSGPVEGFRTFSPNPVPAGPPASGCPNEAARQGPSALLPDCRAYEQVTPVNKGVAEDMFNEIGSLRIISSFGFPSEEGNQFLLVTPSSIGANAAAQENGYVFSRAASEWTMSSLAVPGLGVQNIAPFDHLFNPADLSEVGFHDELGAVPANHGGEGRDALVAGPPGGPYEGPYAPMIVPAGTQAQLAGATNDLSHVIIESRSHELAPGAMGQVPGSNALYDWSAGHLSLVNVNSDGSLVSSCGAMLGQNAQGNTGGGGTHGAVSSDGSKVFFTAPDPYAPGGPGCSSSSSPPQLYMRVNGATTVQISAPEPGVTVKDPTPYAAVYVGASADGSRVFFMSQGELTADDPGHATELYEYNTLTSKLARVSSGDSGTAVGEVGFVSAVSSDGSTVYFGASGRLAPGAPAGGGLYRYDTLSKQTAYITTGAAYPDAYRDERVGNWTGAVGLNDRANWYTTANGRYLVFPSDQPVTGYDSTEAAGGRCHTSNPLGTGSEPGSCVELYRYDAADSSIVCVSCGGPPPVDNALFARAGASVGPQSLSPRPISEDGSRVFFDTASALVPGASPGRTHVYEWHEGVIALLSPAHDPHGSYFLGTSADGANVFIGTHAQLVAQDTDNAGDLYDVRLGGGLGEVAAPTCTGTGCQGVPPAPPIFATPSSTTFEGLGNFPAGSRGAPGRPKTNAQKLTEALKTCKKRYRNAHRRAQCDARARKRYPLAHKSNAHKSTRGGK